ncbi:MAG: hypothetical protein V3R85_09290 [Alphaproteobacteria bacterium]
MASSTHPWSLKGITPAAREAAKQAAEAEGVTLGIWLTRLISDVAADQGITEADIVDRSAPRVVVAEPSPQIPSRPSSIERLMKRNGDGLAEPHDVESQG